MAAKTDAQKLAEGIGDPDLQDDIIDSQQQMGLEAEERQLTEESALEKLDVLEGLRQMQTADPIRWKVYRFGHEEHKYNGYLGDLTTTSLTQEYLRKKFGGGSYRVRGFFSHGGYAAQRQVHIAGESILYVPETINAAAPMTSGATPSQFNLSEFMTAQELRDEKRRDAEQRRAEEEERRAERRAKENRDFILAIGAVVAPIATAFISRTTPPPPTTDVAALVTALRKDTPTENPISGMKGMLEIMTMMRELMPVSDGGASETVEMVKAVAGIAGPALQAFNQNRQPGVRPRVRPAPSPTAVPTPPTRPAPVTIDAVPVAPTPIVRPPVPGEQPTVMQASAPSATSGVDLSAPSQPMSAGESSMFAQLKPQVDTLVQMARDGQDAAAVGDMFYEQFLSTVNDEMYDQLCDLFENPKTLERIALFNSGVKDFLPWFNTLQQTIIAKIRTEAAQATLANPEEADPEGQPA